MTKLYDIYTEYPSNWKILLNDKETRYCIGGYWVNQLFTKCSDLLFCESEVVEVDLEGTHPVIKCVIKT